MRSGASVLSFCFSRAVLYGGFRLDHLWAPWRQPQGSPPNRVDTRPPTDRAILAPLPFTSSWTNTTKPSRACGMSDSSAATASGGVTGTPPSPAISIAACSNQVSPASFARGVAPSFSWLSPAKVADSARRAAQNGRLFFPSCSNKTFSPMSLTLNGFSRFQKCPGPISYFIESFSESSHDSPTKPYAR